MAKVPQYNRQVNAAPLPSVRQEAAADPNAYGASTARAVSGLGQELTSIQDLMYKRQLELKQQDDVRKVMDIRTKINADYMERFYTGENSILRREGLNALEDKTSGRKSAYQDADEYLTTREQDFIGMADNDTQRQLVKNYLFEHNEMYRRNAALHQAKQSEVATDDLVNARIDQARTIALTVYNNPDLFNKNIASLNQEVTAAMMAHGKPKQAIDQKIQEINSKLIASAAEIAINNNDLSGAKSLLERHGASMDPLVRSKYESVVREKVDKEQDYKTLNDITRDPRFQTDGIFDEKKAGEYLRSQKNTGSADGKKVIAAGEQQLGTPYQLGGNGVSATDCGLFTQDTFKKVGVDLGTRAADGQYRNLETKGSTFTDRNQLKEGDLVFFSGTSTRWTPSDDPAAVNDPNKAYKGITHVGIYAGNGKVLQAGSQGVSYADVDAIGEIASYGRVVSGEGVSTPQYSEEKLAWFGSHFRAEAGRQREQQRRDGQKNYESLLDTIYALDGNPSEQLKAIDEATNIPTTKRLALRKSIVNPLIAEQKKAAKETAVGALSELHSKGRLTIEDVHQMAGVFDQGTFQQWISKARESEKGAARNANDIADEQWIKYLPNVPGYEKEEVRKKYIGGLVADMDNNGLQGQDRYTYALDRINNAAKYKDALVNYDKTQTASFDTIVATYGPEVAAAVNAGWIEEKRKNKHAAAPNYGTTLVWLAEAYKTIEKEGWNGPTGIAMTRTIQKGLPLERDLFWQKRDDIAAKMGWE